MGRMRETPTPRSRADSLRKPPLSYDPLSTRSRERQPGTHDWRNRLLASRNSGASLKFRIFI